MYLYCPLEIRLTYYLKILIKNSPLSRSVSAQTTSHAKFSESIKSENLSSLFLPNRNGFFILILPPLQLSPWILSHLFLLYIYSPPLHCSTFYIFCLSHSKMDFLHMKPQALVKHIRKTLQALTSVLLFKTESNILLLSRSPDFVSDVLPRVLDTFGSWEWLFYLC